MTDRAVITGTFSEAKFIKTRSVMVICVEVPIEGADMAFKALGGVPQPGKEVAVAVARLNTNGPEPKARRGSLAQQAGIMCGEPAFLVFLEETLNSNINGDFEAAKAVREICEVDSRAEFDSDPAAGQRWRDLKGQYDAWKLL